jgi:hypothetical protein
MNAIEDRFEKRFDGVDSTLSQHFRRLVGSQITILLAVVGALLARP